MSDIYEEFEQRMFELHELTPAQGFECPRRVVGRRCIRLNGAHACVCVKHRQVLDHVRIWRDAEGALVVTAEPYDLKGSEVAELVADLKPLGIRVLISSRSAWFPPYTTLLKLVKEPA